MNNKENCILVDWVPKEDWNFKRYLEKYTDESWTVRSLKANGKQNNIIAKFKNVYLKQILFPLIIFFQRNRYKKIVAWQQFYGIILAFYCKLFRAKKCPEIVITTFIFKQKRGILGKIYLKFIRYSITSIYIKKIICFSESEISYYKKIFRMKDNKFIHINYAIDDDVIDDNSFFDCNEKYFLCAGRSNRDYDFLINSLKNTNYKVKIICDTLNAKSTDNIEIKKDVYGQDYINYMKKCFAVIIPLKDENVSSGQLVFLKAMQLGKPVIITKNNSVFSYINNEENGLIINKNKEELINSIKRLEDKEYYINISNNSKIIYKKRFSFENFVKEIAQIIIA